MPRTRIDVAPAQRKTDLSSPSPRGHPQPFAEPVGSNGLGLREQSFLDPQPAYQPAPRYNLARDPGAPPWDNITQQTRTLASALDWLRDALMACDELARVIHVNTRLQSFLEGDPFGPRVEKAMRDLARELSAGRSSRLPYRESSDPAAMTREVGTPLGVHQLRGIILAPGTLGAGVRCVVALDTYCFNPVPRTVEYVAACFRLTPREARVALLLAARRSNHEVAWELRISPHTARHHTERVLRKLGIASRRDVASVLEAAMARGLEKAQP